MASSKEEVLEILVEFKQDVDELKTIAQYEKEELEEARRNGVKNIQNHYAALNIDKYAESKRKQVNEETLKAIQDLKDADSIDVINNIVKGYISSHPVSNSNNSGLITVIIVSSVVLVAGLGLLTFFLIRRRRKAL